MFWAAVRNLILTLEWIREFRAIAHESLMNEDNNETMWIRSYALKIKPECWSNQICKTFKGIYLLKFHGDYS